MSGAMKPNIKIMALEDELPLQRVLRFMLENEGFSAQVFASAEDGLYYLRDSDRPNLILLDIMMPGMSGLECLKTLKNDSTTRNIPVIMLTALAQENIVMQGIKLGAVDYIRKPFQPKELVARIHKHIRA